MNYTTQTVVFLGVWLMLLLVYDLWAAHAYGLEYTVSGVIQRAARAWPWLAWLGAFLFLGLWLHLFRS